MCCAHITHVSLGKVGGLLRDWRRINVAFTRARTKLVIFGSRTTLEGTSLFKEFLTIVDKNSWVSGMSEKGVAAVGIRFNTNIAVKSPVSTLSSTSPHHPFHTGG